MDADWEQLAKQYFDLTEPSGAQFGPELHARNMAASDLIGRAVSALPKDSKVALSWFTDALRRDPERWFVARVMSKATPVPRALLDPLLLAALSEPNPSAIRVFIDPCVRTFGGSQVAARIAALANEPGVAANGGVGKAMYWVPKVGA